MQVEVTAFMDGQGDTLAPPQPFRNLIAQVRSGKSHSDHERFFTEMLGDIDTPSLPFGLTDVHGHGDDIVSLYRKLPQDLNDRLRRHAKHLGVSVASLCHLAWALVISRTSGEDRVVFGTVLFGRMQSGQGSDNAMGLFINTLPLRVDVQGGVRESVLQTHERLASLLNHEHASLALTQQCSNIPQGTPLFSSLLNYRHNTVVRDDTSIYPGIEQVESVERTNYPFSLSVEDYGTSLGVTTDVISSLDPARICGYMQQALESLSEALDRTPDTDIQGLDILPAEERRLLLQAWNMTQEEYPAHICLHHLFEQQAERTPEAAAVVFMDQSLTYSELNERANRLAHYLIELGVQPDTRVAICVDRSIAMIVGVLAVLKSGGAYVPLDPTYASDRLRDILADAEPTIVIADESGQSVLGQEVLCSMNVVNPNSQTVGAKAELSNMDGAACNPNVQDLSSSNLAYIIYTSGSTGKPKGVLIEHQGVVNFVCGRLKKFDIPSSSRVLQFTSLGFDNSVSEIFSTLAAGACLHLIQNDTRLDRSQLCNYIESHSITYLSVSPAFLQDTNDFPVLNAMKTLITMGEALNTSVIPKIRKVVPNSSIVNEYGPTEISVTACTWNCQQDCKETIAPIGRPTSNKKVYILDKHRNPVPLGVAGELFIGGVGVARGYLNRPELTAQVFLPDPFANEPSARMYKTGDLVRYLPDGNIMFLGRNDHQVKIRGFRIELGEIEARLSEHPLVDKAIVLALGEGSTKQLVAYAVSKPDDNLVHTLRSHLASCLPDYMVPAAIVRLDSIPLSSSGKIDRKALPAPDSSSFARQDYEEPLGEVEIGIAQIWSELLNIDKISRNDNFFALGGHSLLAVQLIERLRRIGLSVPVRNLFKSPTLQALSQTVDR
ncbi:hypothetical protein BGX31_002824, partial [Mortierella sp. GBA43]